MEHTAAYIDVRGPWPTLVNGNICITLHGCDMRDITVQEVKYWGVNFGGAANWTATDEDKRVLQLIY